MLRLFASSAPGTLALGAACGRLSRAVIGARFKSPRLADCFLPLARVSEWTRDPDSHRVSQFCRPTARRLYLSRDEGNGTKFGETNGDCTRTTAFTVLDAYYYTMVSIENG
jgi:hypothetical protein